MAKEVTRAGLIKQYFGRPDQDLKTFMAEFKTLTPEDVIELSDAIFAERKASGEDIVWKTN